MRELRVLLPEDTAEEIERRVRRGDFSGASELIREAVSYYLARHGDPDWEHYLSTEVEFSRRHAGR
jgi:Arc/MetJ-type ribon-helix-helix transcriptional regulator